MAEEEGSANEAVALKHKFQDLISELKRSSESTLDASNSFCQDFCQVLVHYGCRWRPDEDLLPLLEMYTVAIMCCAEASPFLSPECEHVTDVLNKLSWSCLNLLLSFSEQIPGALWEEFQSSVKMAHCILQAHGNSQLHTLLTLAEENGVWSNVTLCSILSSDISNVEQVHQFLSQEGPELLHMRIKHLIKQRHMEKAARLAKTCAEYPEFGGKKNFKQIYLVCLCEIKPQQELMQEIKEVDCKEALDMICNLESEEDEKGALSLCTAFFKRQLLSGDAYCAWELTLFWSKLLIRLESKQAFLEQCRLLARLSESVYHILLLIKVIQAEAEKDGLSACIEMCIQALKMGVHDKEGCNITICKTISCLLPLDLEVKQACQLTEFLIQPSLDSYYAVETLFNEPDQKLEQEDPPILNSLRCDLLLALKTKWPFDPEFWDWKTLKRQCLALMGQEATAIMSSDKFTDSEDNEVHDPDENCFRNLHFTDSSNYEVSEVEAERKKKREMKKMRERGFVSARFRNWQAYMQYCVLCDKEFLGHRIVKHALKHVQDGIFRCPICAKTFETRAILEPHVASHVKESCKERLAAMGVSKKRTSFETGLTPASSTLRKEEHYSKTDVKVIQGAVCNNSLYASTGSPSTDVKSKMKSSSPRQGNPIRDVNNTKDCSCPVTSCKKVFKYFRNLVAHVKAHKNEQEATHFLEIQSQKALCQYCHRQFVNMTHLNDHLQMHCGEKPYFCIQLGCNCSFSSHAELLMHRKVHAEFQAQCAYPSCERIFNETYLLYDHEAQHYVTFSCKIHNCDKVFYTLSELDLHQKGHAKQEDHSAVDRRLPSHLEEPAQTCPALELPPSQIKEVSQDFTPIEMKCTAESIVDSTKDSTEQPEHLIPCTSQFTGSQNDSETNSQCNESQASHCLESTKQLRLESCYVKLKPITIKCSDPMYLNALRNADSETQALLKDEKLFSFPCSQLNPSISKSSHSVTKANKEERLTHVCPFESCTRKYSTSKSLSRHVKNVHSEAFEEWKLSKKYKRIADIAAKKSGHATTSSQIPKWTSSSRPSEHATFVDSVLQSPSSVFSDCDSIQSVGRKFCSQLENTQSATSLNETDLMQLPVTQAWVSPSDENLNSSFSAHDPYRSTILSGNQHTNPSYHSETILDYASASSFDIIPLSGNAHTPSSVMNEASKYVSSSLRVLHALNGDQTCDLSQVESRVNPTFNEIGQDDNQSMIINDVSISTGLHTGPLSGHNVSLYFSTLPSETNPVSVQLIGNPNKEISTDSTDELFSSDIKSMSNLLTPHLKESSEDFFSVSALTDEKSPEDICNHELSQEGTEGILSDDQNVSGSGETRKSKKMKSSKRTKWPAIIQDGKVICCRCYREFSSTKSLGGHLSKRSQCKPVDEIDLTADLPVSFLDFLNDPEISAVQMPLPANDILENNQKSCIYAPSESSNFNSNSLTSIQSTESLQNANVPCQDSPDVTGNFFHPPLPNKDSEIKPEAEIISGNTGEDGIIVEIERALQRLDLVDILSHDQCVSESTDLHNLSSEAVTRNDQHITIQDPIQNEQKCILKPFRCEEGCVYGAMTKEALFKHLSRVHDYSEDRINEMKKNPDRLAPYNCHLCSKTFTRTTGLKIHYKNVHHFSKEEMSRLKIGLGYRKIRKSTVESENVCTTLIVDQGNDCQSEKFQHQINPILTVTPVDSEVKAEAKTVGKRKKKHHTPTSLIVSSTETCKTLEVSQKNVGNLDGLSATCVKLEGTPVASAGHVSQLNDPDIFAAQKLSGESPYLFDTINALDTQTEYATPQYNRQIETKSTPMVDIQEKNKLPMDIDSGDSVDAPSMYRPYRCVHEGCVAAFSIQQNLILHYRAMHQSECDEKNNAKAPDGVVQVQEYRCQVKQCSKVVSKVTSLLKHYLLLHRCTLEKASALLSGVEVGTFQCDQSKCSAHFTCHLKYIDHIKNDHKAIKVSVDGDFESVNLTFRCQFQGCDRVYTTKSNLLRHLMKKHDATFETMKEKQENGIGGDVPAKKLVGNADSINGKENIANNNIKMKRKISKKKDDKAQNNKPTLKSIDEASAMCNQIFPIQYPCMIKSCNSVMSAEQSILKHYTTHGFTERFIEDQRSQFIFCMKSSEMPKADSTSKNVELEETVFDDAQTEDSKVSSQDVGPEPATEVLVNEGFTATMPVVKRKRGRPRKSECRNKICVERKQSLRNCADEHVKCMLKVSGSILNSSNAQGNHVEEKVALKLYRPSEFETSVLKFSEDSLSNSSKRQRMLQPVIQERDHVQCVVNFRNPQKIETVKNVKIVVYKKQSPCSELLLKQLQDMQPLVILEKRLHS